jgi:hypothetical protein
VKNVEVSISKRRSRLVQVAVLGVTLLCIAALDIAGGRQVSPWALYLLPVIAAAGLFGRRTAMGSALMAVALIAFAAAVSGHPFESWGFFAASLANRAVCLVICAWLASHLFRAQPDTDRYTGTGIGNY